MFSPARIIRSLSIVLLGAAPFAAPAFAQNANPANQNAQTQNQGKKPVLVSPMFGSYGPGSNPTPIRPFGTYNPNRAASYGTYRYNPTDNEVHHYTSPLSPFATYQPRYTPYFTNYNVTDTHYTNGLYSNGIFTYGWCEAIFPNGAASYPYYVPGFINGATYFSPYSYYWQTAPSFILAETVYQAPPQVIYVPVPIYMDGAYRGERREDIDDYYLNRAPKNEDGQNGKAGGKPDADPADGQEKAEAQNARAVDRAAADIAKAWRTRDIQILSNYIDAKAKIAISLRGRYQYSLDARDYLDLTSDAFKATKTVRFELDAPVRKERGVYLLNGKHIYQAKDGTERTVHVNYVLELQEEKYRITQVGSAPDKLEE